MRGFHRVKLRSAALSLAALAIATGCQLLYGDYSVGESDGGVDGPKLPRPLCGPDEFRCNGAWLYSCNGARDAWQYLDECKTAALCDARQGRCNECRASERRCQGAELQVCNAEQTDWEVLEDCGTADQCNTNSDSCTPCTPGEHQCVEASLQASLQRCSNAGSWQPVDTCSTAALCTVSADHQTGECDTAACEEPGKHRCDGTQLLRCAPGLDREVQVEVCPTAALCNAPAADAVADQGGLGACQPAVCQPGDMRCAGKELQECRADRTGWEVVKSCQTPGHCSTEDAACTLCIPGTYQCNDAQLEQCTAQQSWEVVETCATAALCNATAKRCLDPGCGPAGRVECRADTPQLQWCPPDRIEWKQLEMCSTPALCNAGSRRCDPPMCENNPAQSRCEDSSYQECNSDRTGWDTIVTCAPGACDLDTKGCSTTPCTAGDYRCNDGYLELCESAAWQRTNRCATHALCDAETGTCREPKCEEGEFKCLGQSLRRCRPSRDDWQEMATCGPGLVCDEDIGECREPDESS